ncbi:MAG: xanthine dehydrogenase accessory protein XdhC [Hyphomicrobiales bacterium]|nr:xanthine dehydrogenase accessory protein XdhC [Hyphomicrobiales bacterium]
MIDAARALLASGQGACLVRVAEALGSTPREAGAVMLVLADTTLGTIGGGSMEFDAIERARALLAQGEAAAQLDILLGPEADQCCGGKVRLALHRLDDTQLQALEAAAAAQRRALPTVLLFGAGHVGRALAAALGPLPLNIRWIEARPEAFPALVPPFVVTVLAPLLLDEVARAPRGAAMLVVTHSHALDYFLCEAALRRGDFAYLGLIGSKSKKARFLHHLRDAGLAQEQLARLTCPIGGTLVHDKRPEVIAALATAELLTALATTVSGTRRKS